MQSNPIQSRQTRASLATPEDSLSYELGKAVQELPPLYTRLLAGCIGFLVLGAIAWAYFSKVDEVAVAPGELIASVQVRPVRSLGDGKIREVRVKEGDRVEKGDILVERDPELPQSQVNRLAKSTQLIQADVERLEAERTGSSEAGTNLQNQLLTARLQDYETRRAAAEAEANKQLAAINSAKVRLARLQENLLNAKTNLANAKSLLINAQSILENAETREKGLSTLLTPGAVPRIDYLDTQGRVIQAKAEVKKANDDIINAQDKAISLEKDRDAQLQEIKQAEEAYSSAQKQVEQLKTERQSEILTELNKRREELSDTSGQLEQATKQREQETITSPISGTVYSVKATKGPVQSGEELLSILPQGEELLVEVKVLNRDIGFIQPGMRAKVKMATFPFQEFGTVEGTVVKVSPNAIADKELGLVFPTQIRLNKHSLEVRGKKVAFTPGMAATGEIVTRRKSILTFLVEPVTRRFSEAFPAR